MASAANNVTCVGLPSNVIDKMSRTDIEKLIKDTNEALAEATLAKDDKRISQLVKDLENCEYALTNKPALRNESNNALQSELNNSVEEDLYNMTEELNIKQTQLVNTNKKIFDYNEYIRKVKSTRSDPKNVNKNKVTKLNFITRAQNAIQILQTKSDKLMSEINILINEIKSIAPKYNSNGGSRKNIYKKRKLYSSSKRSKSQKSKKSKKTRKTRKH